MVSSSSGSDVAKFTHLVIDEVHERSVDTDLLLYFAKDMLEKFKHFKVVLMSATLCSSKYANYFAGCDVSPVIHVGVSRFENTMIHLNDLVNKSSNIYESSSTLKEICHSPCVRLSKMMQSERPEEAVKDKKVLLVQVRFFFFFS